MRVLHCPNEIAGNMARICKYLRANGIDAISMNRLNTGALNYKCDINIDHRTFNQQEAEKWYNWVVEQNFDIIHYHFPLAGTLLPDFSDLPKLKAMGRKIVVSYWGSDQRGFEWSIYNKVKYLGYSPPKPFFLTPKHVLIQDIVLKYADAVFAQECVPFFVPYLGLIDISEWNRKEKEKCINEKIFTKESGKVYFVHSASSTFKKGSHLIANGFNRVRDAGIPAELILVSGVSPLDAKMIYAHADFGIEGIGGGANGLFGCELMAWGIPVFVYKTNVGDKTRFNPPTIHIDDKSFVDVIAKWTKLKLEGNIELDIRCRDSLEYVRRCDILAGGWINTIVNTYDSVTQNRCTFHHNNFPRWMQETENIRHCLVTNKSPNRSEFYRYLQENDLISRLKLDMVVNNDGKKMIDSLWNKQLYVGSDE